MKNLKQFSPPLMEGEDGFIPRTGTDGNECLADTGAWSCTLAKGHEGPHAAHGDGLIATWEENNGPS